MTTPSQVFSAVAAAFGVHEGFYATPTRTLALTYARFAAWKILRDHDSMMTLTRLGQLSNRDHGSVIHGLKRASDLLENDEQFKERYDEAMLRLQQQPVHLTTIYT